MDIDKYGKILKMLEGLANIQLHEDPAAAGLSAVNEKIAEITNKKSTATIVMNKIIVKRAHFKQKVVNLKSLYKQTYASLLATDEDVAEGKSKDERAAIANVICKPTLEELDVAIEKHESYEALYECAQNTLASIKIAKEAISRQLSVIMAQLQMNEVDKKTWDR